MWDWLMTNGKICIQTCPIKDAEFNASLVFRHQSKSVHREACQRSDRKISFAKCLSKRFSQNLKENLVLLWKNLNEFWIVFFHSDIYLQIRISFKYRTKKMMHGYFLSFFFDSTWPIDILGLWKMYFSDHMLVSNLGSFFTTLGQNILLLKALSLSWKFKSQDFIKSRVFGQKLDFCNSACQ